LRERGCGQIGASCLATGGNGACTTASFTFSCPDKPASAIDKTVCDKSYCAGDVGCFDTTSAADQDFGQAAALLEVSRQAGVYGIDPAKVEIFKGYAEECSVKVLGGSSIKSCCTAAGGGGSYSNHALLTAGLKAGGAIGGEYGAQAVKSGSSYVYDALYGKTDSALIDKGLVSMNDWASGLSGGADFGAYGFTFSYSYEAGFSFVSFDPSSFAASVALQIIAQWLSCDVNEQVLQMKKGQNLCVYTDSYCASKSLGVCTEVKERSCCFNSVLAKTVNQQGRRQLGLPLNQCGGFNQIQIEALDFSRMDFSEFIASIHVAPVDNTALNNQVNGTVQQKISDYYGQ
jgi:conjugal transfer mating pair stabilization protein TraN